MNPRCEVLAGVFQSELIFCVAHIFVPLLSPAASGFVTGSKTRGEAECQQLEQV